MLLWSALPGKQMVGDREFIYRALHSIAGHEVLLDVPVSPLRDQQQLAHWLQAPVGPGFLQQQQEQQKYGHSTNTRKSPTHRSREFHKSVNLTTSTLQATQTGLPHLIIIRFFLELKMTFFLEWDTKLSDVTLTFLGLSKERTFDKGRLGYRPLCSVPTELCTKSTTCNIPLRQPEWRPTVGQLDFQVHLLGPDTHQTVLLHRKF
ncbi:hypothetical protein CB1_001792015 [Camelus ferus]|nr:hypothetical protein CB1_001792015 [Camelus ferus]